MAPLTPTASVTQPSGARRMYGTAADVVRTPLAPTPADVAPVDRAAAEQEELEVSIRLMEDSAADWEEEIEHLYPRRTA